MKRILLYCSFWGVLNLLTEDYKVLFVLLSVLITFCSVWEAFLLFRKYGTKVLLSPFVVCCLYMFAINFGLSNFIFVAPAYEQYFDFFIFNYFSNTQDFYYWLSQAINHVFLGFIFMLAGYKFEDKTSLVTNFTRFLFQTKVFLISSFDIKLWKVILLWLLSCGIKIFTIVRGLYGFTASSVALEENKGIVQFLYYGTIVSKGALFFLCLLYFLKPKNLRVIISLIVVIALELFFGLLSGFKSQLMIPFIILFFASIIVTKRIKVKFIIPIILSVFLAYALVEPMRAASYGVRSDKTVNASELIEIATTGVKEKSISEDETLPFLYVFMYRNSLSVFVAIANKEASYNKRYYPHLDIERKMFFSPVLAYVPRAIWPDKPIISNGGIIYNREVLGASDDDSSSVAISPFGFFLLGTHYSLLYIICFFFILGMLQYYFFSLYLNYGLGGLIVCMGMLVTLGIVEEPYSVLIAYFKDLPIFIAFQFLFLYNFKRKSL